jgi:hypothetical protein
VSGEHKPRKRATLGYALLTLMTLLTLMAACGSQADDIREQRDLWRERHLRDYVLDVSSARFLDPDIAGSRVTVLDGHATAVQINGLPSTHGQTVDEMFDTALEIAESPFGDAATFHYDPKEHVITQISSEGDPNAIDDELSIRSWCFSKDVTLGCPLITKSGADCAAEHGTVTPIASLESPQSTCPNNGFSLGAVTEQPDAVCCWLSAL